MKTRNTKQFMIDPALLVQARKRAKKQGMTFTQYIQYLLNQDLNEDAQAIPMVDKETEKSIAQSLKEFKEGNYETIEPGDTNAIKQLCGLK
jgi:antitoxin component of RelBE/YafQ-DinJ toxin-antitoxin module